MPSTLPIREFGRGRVTARNASHLEPGEARDSLNILHNYAATTAKLRNALDRVWATRPANAVTLAVIEYDQNDGTVKYLAKVGAVLYTFDLTPTTTVTSIKTGLTASNLAQMAIASNLVFIADWADKNYVSDGTAGGTNELQKAAPTGVFTLASAGTATGNAAGSIKYWYSDYDPTTATESPPSASVTVSRTVNQGVTVTNSSLTFTAPYTQKSLYRTRAGSSQPYRVTTGLTAVSFPYADTSLDTSLSTVSEIHDDAGSAAIEKPEAAKHVCFHRGRLFLGNLSGHPSRLRWSMLFEPTQYSNASNAYRDIGLSDGDEITGVVSFRGSLVIFKRQSIWIMNGDDEESNFTFFSAVTGIGCVAPRTIAKDGDNAIYFLSACGAYSFDLSSAREVSKPIAPDLDALDYVNRRNFFCAGIDPCNNLYLLSATPTGGSTNTTTHVLNLETGAWGRFQGAMGKIVPSCYSNTSDVGPIRNSGGMVKLYVGDTNGYLYETESATGADGVTSGTKSATVTGSTPTTTTCSAASFRTTGDGLKGVSLTVRRASGSTYETVEISSNTGTVLTHGGWTGTAPVAGDTVYVGAYQGTLSLGRFDADQAGIKRFHRIAAEFEKQSHSIPLRVGYAIDGESVPSETAEIDMSTGFRAEVPVLRRGAGLSTYFDIIGVSHPFELLLIEVVFDAFQKRLPTR